MAILTDTDIVKALQERHLSIHPYDYANLQPASYDFHLHEEILVPAPTNTRQVIVDPDITSGDLFWLPHTLPKILFPGEVVLGRSVEVFGFPADIIGRLEGVSTLGRWFVQVHITAGFFDPAFRGTATIEIKNQGPFRVRLTPRMRIGQMAFERTESPSHKVYGDNNRYYGQIDATASRPRPTKGASHARKDPN